MYKIITTLHGYKDKDEKISTFDIKNVYSWFLPAIKHNQKLNSLCENHIITDLDIRENLGNNVYIHNPIESLETDFLKNNYIHLSLNPFSLEYNSIMRFLYLRNFCIKNQVNEFLYLEPDVLIFSNVLEDKDYMKKNGYDVTLMLDRCAGVCFFNNAIKVLDEIKNLIMNSYSDPQKEPKAFDINFYKLCALNNYNYGGVTDMHFWNWYSNKNKEKVLGNMDKNDNGVFWHTCIIRDMFAKNYTDGSNFELSRWSNHLDNTINRNIKTVEIENGKCYSYYNEEKVQIKYLHFNENTKLLMKEYTKYNN